MTSPTYDALWKTAWGAMQQHGPVHRHIREDLVRIVSQLPDCQTVLDAGCGSGENLRVLAAQHRWQLTGIDVSQEALDLAHRAVPDARLFCLDLERESLDERFDVVLSIQVIEHLLDDIRALRHLGAMATRYVFVSTIAGRMRPSELQIGHVRNYSRIELTRKLTAAGLEVVDMYGWGFPLYSPLYRTASEWLPGGPPAGAIGRAGQLAAQALYQLYRLNIRRHGDVLSVLARPAG